MSGGNKWRGGDKEKGEEGAALESFHFDFDFDFDFFTMVIFARRPFGYYVFVETVWYLKLLFVQWECGEVKVLTLGTVRNEQIYLILINSLFCQC